MGANQYTGPIPLAERFWEKVDVQSGDDCWVWTASLNGNGYGQINDGSRPQLAHRVAYELEVGPIPTDEEAGFRVTIDHLCRTPACVNPNHLEIVSNRTNSLRGTGIPAVNAAKTHCPRGHEYTPDNTYMNPRRNGRPSRRCRECMRIRSRKRYARQKHLKALDIPPPTQQSDDGPEAA